MCRGDACRPAFEGCAGVKRSCSHFVAPNGQVIRFDAYNLFYRNGRIDEIRARLKAETTP